MDGLTIRPASECRWDLLSLGTIWRLSAISSGRMDDRFRIVIVRGLSTGRSGFLSGACVCPRKP
jgi:hypothetical protein